MATSGCNNHRSCMRLTMSWPRICTRIAWQEPHQHVLGTVIHVLLFRVPQLSAIHSIPTLKLDGAGLAALPRHLIDALWLRGAAGEL
jgi:hypothetical protein